MMSDDEAASEALFEAVNAGDLQRAAALLDAGASLHEDLWGFSLLDEALERADEAMARLLIDRGADLLSRDERGRTALHRAAAGGDDPAIVRLLIRLGTPVDVADSDGWTPLHSASAYGYHEVAAVLVAAGADESATTNAGKLPSDLREINHLAPSDSVRRRLDTTWDAQWDAVPPVGHLLPALVADRWVRFHALPGSKRYPESEAEYGTILARHRTLLTHLGLVDRGFVTAMRFFDGMLPAWSADRIGLPRAEEWRIVRPSHGEEMSVAVYATEVEFPTAEFDDMLRAVVDDTLAGVVIVPAAGKWLYHPYDGGMDVIAESPAARDALAVEFAGWLSEHPAGL